MVNINEPIVLAIDPRPAFIRRERKEFERRVAAGLITGGAVGFDAPPSFRAVTDRAAREAAPPSFRAVTDRAAREAAAREVAAREAAVSSFRGQVSFIGDERGSLERQSSSLEAEGRKIDALQANIDRRQASLITRGTVATNRLVLDFNKKAAAFNTKAAALGAKVDAFNVKASQSGVRARELGVQLSAKEQQGIVFIEKPATPLGFDVRATQPFQVSEEILARSRAQQLAIGGAVAAGAVFPGISIAAGAPLAVIGGQLAGGFLVGEGARIGAERVVSEFEPGVVTEFVPSRPPPNIDVRATIGEIEQEFAGTETFAFERPETFAEVEARKDFVVTAASLIGFAAGARVGGGVIQGVQAILSKSKAKIVLTTDSIKTRGKQFLKTGKNEVTIKVEKGSFIQKSDGKIIPITGKGFIVSPTTQGKFISGGRAGILGQGTTDLAPSGEFFAPGPVFTPTTTPGISPLFGTPLRPLTVSEALEVRKGRRFVSPKPGVFDIGGIPIPTQPLAFKRPQTVKEVLEFRKGLRFVSPKPGVFDIEGRPIPLMKGFKKPVTAAEALFLTREIRRVSPKPGIFDIRGQRIGEPFKKRKPGPFRFREEFLGFEKPVKIRPVRPSREVFGARTVSVQKQVVKPISIQQAIPGSLAALSVGLPRVVKEPTQLLFEREFLEAFGLQPAKPVKRMGLFDVSAKSIFEPPKLTAFEKQIRGQVRKEVGERQRFETFLRITPLQKQLKKEKKARKVTTKELFGFAPLEGFADLTKPLAIPTVRGAARISEAQRERELERQRQRFRERQMPRLRERQRERERERQREREKLKEKLKLRPLLRPMLLEKVKAKRKRVKKVQAFKALVKKKGKFVKVSKRPLRKNTALALGAFLVDNSAAQTFRIREIMGNPTGPKVSRPSLSKFRKPIRSGRTQAKSPLFIEKTAFLIDRKGELEAITKRGLNALRQSFFRKRKARKIKRRRKK